ncbi:polygalacturonase [Amborella trichopoda]|uniref:Polygalacturonase n=1 Tax=Amborella trichopoda TaxID=13333 RepID=W1PAV6_AMBTC|nr:polygalacturonase [Amborella trichopoda]ERN07042.1 hypothetical protein AMTR_s00019p00031370 [Amborella trichopoda]|eukprot:XP_020523725.1 polygalacturonase [Amborella trichopoda]
MNSQLGHIAFNGCEDITVNGVTVRASGDSPNTDGIHVQQSVNIVIINTSIRTGDDCISIGPGTQNLWIEHMACGPGHGISIGSLGKDLEEPGVENVTVKDVVLSGTQNGVRIKTWARESNGYVRGVLFEEALMINVNNPIIIDQDYCPHNLNCPNQGSGVKISGVKYRNIRGTSASKVAVTFNCSPNAPCQDIRMENVELTYLNQLAQASCSHAEGSSSGVVYPQSCL